METLKYISAKGKNKRAAILLRKGSDGGLFFTVHTRTLKDFKTRHVLKTDLVFSVETFSVLSDLMTAFLDDSEVKNKIISRELGFKKWDATTNLTQ